MTLTSPVLLGPTSCWHRAWWWAQWKHIHVDFCVRSLWGSPPGVPRKKKMLLSTFTICWWHWIPTWVTGYLAGLILCIWHSTVHPKSKVVHLASPNDKFSKKKKINTNLGKELCVEHGLAFTGLCATVDLGFQCVGLDFTECPPQAIDWSILAMHSNSLHSLSSAAHF